MSVHGSTTVYLNVSLAQNLEPGSASPQQAPPKRGYRYPQPDTGARATYHGGWICRLGRPGRPAPPRTRMTRSAHILYRTVARAAYAYASIHAFNSSRKEDGHARTRCAYPTRPTPPQSTVRTKHAKLKPAFPGMGSTSMKGTTGQGLANGRDGDG
jgi:hypothetical protein